MSLRPLLVLAAVALTAVAAYFIWDGRRELPELPRDREEMTPSAEFDDAAEAADYYRAWLRREPDAVEPRVRLAHALLQLATETGDETRYLPEAQEALEGALERDPEHYYGRTIYASLLNKLHRFEEARDLSRALLEDHPAHAYVHGTLIDALVELGEYDEALAASDRLQGLRPGLPAYSRASYLRELHGDGDGAIAAMRRAADAEPHGRLGRAWALAELGHLYIGAAKPDTAAFLFQGILEERPSFAPAVVGLGRVALAKGDAKAAVRHLEEARSMGAGEAADEGLVEAYALLGMDADAKAAEARVLAALHAAREMGEIVDMEEADWLLDTGERFDDALRMAKAQVERRPGHLHANETYAWALMHTGSAERAIPYIERAMRLGTGDGMVHYRAGRIYEAAGRAEQARAQYRAALDANVNAESPLTAGDIRERLGASA